MTKNSDESGFTIIVVFIVSIIVASLAVIGGSLYLKHASTSKNSQTVLVEKPAPSLSSQPSPKQIPTLIESDETRDWPIYTNNKARFQIKYPPRYSKPVVTTNDPKQYLKEATGEEDNQPILFGTSEDSLSIQPVPSNSSLDQITEGVKSLIEYGNSGKTPVKLKQEDFLVNSVPVRFISLESGSIMMVALQVNDHAITIMRNPSSDIETRNTEIKNIISTLKFN